jgi:hypothetical protein
MGMAGSYQKEKKRKDEREETLRVRKTINVRYWVEKPA